MTKRERWEEIDESRASFEGRISVRKTDELIGITRSMRDWIVEQERELAGARRRVESLESDLAERTEIMGSELREIRKMVGLPDGTDDDWSTADLVRARLAEAREMLAKLDARISRLVDALNDQWSRWNTMASDRTRNDGREVVRAAMRAASEALSTAEDATDD